MAVRTIDVRERVMARNDELAALVRQRLRDAGVPAFNLVSSPGSGKTSLLERTLETLGEELGIAVVTDSIRASGGASRRSAARKAWSASSFPSRPSATSPEAFRTQPSTW